MGEFFKIKKTKGKKLKIVTKPFKIAKGLIAVGLGLALFGAARQSLN